MSDIAQGSGCNTESAPKQTGQFIDINLTQAQANQSNRDFLNTLGQQAIKQSLFFTGALQAQVLRDAGLVTDDVLNPVTQGSGNAITATPGVAAGGVAATVPANADAQVVAAWFSNPVNIAAIANAVAQAIQNAKQSPTAGASGA